jgi:hypothetical protein
MLQRAALVLWPLLLLGSPIRAMAQASGGAAGAPAPLPRLVLPGDSTLRGERVVPDTVRYALTLFRDADEVPVGRLTDAVTIEMLGDVRVARRVQLLQRGTDRFVDTTYTDLRTMAPRARRAVQQNRKLHLDFVGARIKGSLGPFDVPPVPLDTTLRIAPFDIGAWDLVLRALPLEKGYAARFPVYDVDAGVREYRLSVTGETTVQGEPAHVVVLTLSRTRESVVWVSIATGQVLQIETLLGEMTMLRQVRVLEAPSRDR